MYVTMTVPGLCNGQTHWLLIFKMKSINGSWHTIISSILTFKIKKGDKKIFFGSIIVFFFFFYNISEIVHNKTINIPGTILNRLWYEFLSSYDFVKQYKMHDFNTQNTVQPLFFSVFENQTIRFFFQCSCKFAWCRYTLLINNKLWFQCRVQKDGRWTMAGKQYGFLRIS